MNATASEQGKQDHLVRGILALILATLFFAGQDAVTKHLTASVAVPQLLFVRYFFFALFALIYASRKRRLRQAFRAHRPLTQLLRGLLIWAEIGMFAYGLRFLGIAEMHSIFACFPLIITALSVPMLGESVGWRRWIAVSAGFIGTLIIIQPGSGVFSTPALIALACAFMFAIYNLVTRKVSRADSFETSLLYFGVVGFAASLTVVPFYWEPLLPQQLILLLLISATSICGHLLLIKSLELAPAVILQPFNYFILVWAMIIGYSFYGEVLEATTLAGAALVVGSGIYIARREYLVARTTQRRLRRAMYPPEA
ncbi:MAG: DMT family transporter [Gammaproteobacteria bacterium]|nr:DMT family transporter [Gammaproteobacteria bacterium]MDH3447903.1 DMT family transporter [Gammaproteobacteria bacterium]